MDYGNVSLTERFAALSTSLDRKPRYSVIVERHGDITSKVKNISLNRRFKEETSFDIKEPVPSIGHVTILDIDGEFIKNGHSTIRQGDKIQIFAGFEPEKIKVPRFAGVVVDPKVNTATRVIECAIADYGWLLKRKFTSGDYSEYNTPRLLVKKLYEELNVRDANFEVTSEYPLSLIGDNNTTYGAHSRQIIDGRVCASLDGTSQYFDGGDVLDIEANDLSMSMWVRTDNLSIGILQGKADPYPDHYYYLAFFLSKIAVAIRGATTFNIWGNTVVTTGTWHHFAFVVDKDNTSNCKCFLDGQDDTKNTSGTMPGTISSSGSFLVGGETGYYYSAIIRGVRIYIASGDHWTDAQVLAQYNNPGAMRGEGMGSMTTVWPFDDFASATMISSADSVPYTHVFGNTTLQRRNYWQLIDGALKAIGYLFYIDQNGALQAKRRDSFTDVDVTFTDSNIIDIQHLRLSELINQKGYSHSGEYPPWRGFSLRDDVRWGESTYTINNDMSQRVYGVKSDYETDDLISGWSNAYLFAKEVLNYYAWPRNIYMMRIAGMPQLEMLDRVKVYSDRRNVQGRYIIIGMQDKLSPGNYEQTLILLSDAERF
jgi:hypothetical protein